MLGPYRATKQGGITYAGNNIFPPIKNIHKIRVSPKEFIKRVEQFESDEMWSHIARINHQINFSVNNFFNEFGAIFTELPLTTRMISSPGAIYGKEAIDYTTDTCPITLKWFELPRVAFLSESSQIYLELALLQRDINQVYSIYSSFRKEKADFTHLSEFHHIEYEAKINQTKNEEIVLSLIQRILYDLFGKNYSNLAYFHSPEKLSELKKFADNLLRVPKITFKEALDILYKDTRNSKYKKFTLKHFGAWEEIRLTEIFQNLVIIKQFPLLEVPFYHAQVDGKFPVVANNADFTWPGYREVVGSGHRVRSLGELEQKAKVFNLPRKDYKPYLQSRRLKSYKETSGFGSHQNSFLESPMMKVYSRFFPSFFT
jgi:aspartyl/asparaginyl-tRNA synthetase